MTTTKRVVRNIGTFPQLDEWLNKHDARFMWRVDGDASTPTVMGWRIGAGVAIVPLYPDMRNGASGGWGVATEPNTNAISETFEDAERRLGIGLSS